MRRETTDGAAEVVHLLGEALLPPCMDAVLTSEPYQGPPGIWSPIASDVTCPTCREWVHA